MNRKGKISLITHITHYNEGLYAEIKLSDNPFSLPLTQEATIIMTSGSAGEQKGVLHTIGNHYYSALGSNQNIPLHPDDCWMVSLPFFHIAGIAILFRTLISGAACYIPDRNQQLRAGEKCPRR